ncbi:hypothetical protein C8255_10295 [filamentous cyanobacterium CCP3]|nr:hypothetical protein C8255_10295 [filamentous cyanobacterium CCP3]
MAFTPILSGSAQIGALKSPEVLSEVQAYIRQCRKVIPVNERVEVYDNTDLETKPANRIGTINVGTNMMLTGVVREAKEGRPTAVQIYMLDRRFPRMQPVGWVDASKITGC